MRSHLVEGTVRHRRARPVEHALEQDVFYLALDLDELDEVARRIRLISRNRRNVLEFRDADHWPEPARDVRESVLAHLRAEGEDPTGWRITLVTSPRILGYVFNPASFYLCRDAAGTLRVVIVEVTNTPHLERHLYTLRPRDDGRQFVASMAKDFYVSPFISIDGQYTVHVQDEPSRLRIAINLRQDGAPVLATSLVLTRRRLTDRNLLRMLLRYPLSTQRTTVAIYLHAWRLWRKGVTFHRHGAAVAEAETRRAAAGRQRAAEGRAAS